jgi:hypothetical protein
MPDSSPLRLFIIYAREDQPALLELKAHLRPLEKRGDLTVWYDGEILPGEDWDKAIKARLAAADIVLLLISSSFFTSDYIEKEELKKALERHRKGEAMVVPVIVRHCVWNEHPEISALQALPKDGKAVVSWVDADEAWADVARGIQRILDRNQKSATPTTQHEVRTSQPRFIYGTLNCFTCSGLGWIVPDLANSNRVKCPTCNGTGRDKILIPDDVSIEDFLKGHY